MKTLLKMLSFVLLAALFACGGKTTPSEQKTKDSLQTIDAVGTETASLISLTKEGKNEGWQFLFDGTGAESTNGGDIITKEQYSDFELMLGYRLGVPTP